VTPVISAHSAEKDGRGRKPKQGVAQAEIAAALGVGETTLRQADQHVNAAARYPELAAPDIPQRDAIG
jgi:hypothetical protein